MEPDKQNQSHFGEGNMNRVSRCQLSLPLLVNPERDRCRTIYLKYICGQILAGYILTGHDRVWCGAILSPAGADHRLFVPPTT